MHGTPLDTDATTYSSVDKKLRLREYQERGTRFLIEKQRAVLGDGAGLGKTPQALIAAKELGATQTLIICSKSAIAVWRDHIEEWLDMPSVMYVGTPSERDKAWKRFCDGRLPFIITNYKLVDQVLAKKDKWDLVIADEYHRYGIINHKTEAYKNMRKIKSGGLFLLTGTPVRRNPMDLFGPFSLINPQEFNSYWRYRSKYCIVTEDDFGHPVIEVKPKNVDEFQEMVKQYLIRRTKEQVLPELPAKIRQPLKIRLEGKQKRLYDKLNNDMIAQMNKDEWVITPNTVTKILRLRQLLVAPQILEIDAPSAALEVLREDALDVLDSGEHIVVFTPFRGAIPYIRYTLEKIKANVYEVHGQQTQKEFEHNSKGFQKDNISRKALICTILSGTAFNAYAANTAFFLGCEWNATDNIQAEDRLHRIGQDKKVNIYYILHEDTIESHVIDVLNEKTLAENWILNPQIVIKRRI